MEQTVLTEIARFVNAFDAEAAVAALRAAGIEAIVKRDDAGRVQPELWMGGVSVLVRPEDAAAAREILDVGRAPQGNGTHRSWPWPRVIALGGALAALAVLAVWLEHQAFVVLPRGIRSILYAVLPVTFGFGLLAVVAIRLLRRRSRLHSH
ncbi:MAG TPA: DUF2007 domain-containing protein [Candidatus Sulfotelmatobacter sp.]|jgi:hypothetical protein|nr:DUF2007 domain-containing protein [Candidatus Sulfotelmatobacter sp.]